MRHLTLRDFKREFDAHLRTFVREKAASAKTLAQNERIEQSVDHAVSLIIGGGKRIRPYLAYLMYETAGGKDPKSIMRALVGLELFHVFALIHDDIIDEGVERHGMPTLHAFYRDSVMPKGKKFEQVSIGQAILVGDLIFNWSREAFEAGVCPAVSGTVSAEAAVAARTLFTELVDEVIVGQMIDVDIMSRDKATATEIERKNELKTARYSFIQPMRIGAALANRAGEFDEYARRVGLALGMAFQIQDDMLDIMGDRRKTGKALMSDLEQGQHTFFTQYVFDNGCVEHRAALKGLFGRPLSDDERKAAKGLFEESGALTNGVTLVKAYCDDATYAVKGAKFGVAHGRRWSELVGLISARTA